jgi:hypothetical protein
MRIYIGGLWSKVGWSDLEALVSQALRGPWYRLYAPRGRMIGCELLQMTDLDNGETDYSAVIDIEPARLGWEVIQHVEGLYAYGQTLSAHKWFERSGMYDRRVPMLDSEASPGMDRRDLVRNDRRRQLNIRPLGKSMVNSVRGFERSYGG